MKVTFRRLLSLAFLALLVAALIYALQPQPLPADFVEVSEGPLVVTIEEEGETRVRDRYVVSAPVAGRILRIELEPGDPVRAGRTVVATFLPTTPNFLDTRSRREAEAAVQAADAELGQARAMKQRAENELRFARTELRRYSALADKGVVSEGELEALQVEAQTREDTFRAAEFAVRSAEQRLEMARAVLIQPGEPGAGSGNSPGQEPIRLRSPIDGVVLQRLQQSEVVLPAGTPIIAVGNPDRLEIVSDFLSTDAVKVIPGNRVLIEQWGGGETLRGKVRRVEPSGFTKISALGVEEQRVNIIIDFEDPREAWAALGDGYAVAVAIVIWETEETVKVPTGSLFRQGGDWAVFVVEEGVAKTRRVEIGRRTGLEAQVLSGLEVGERVIEYPSDDIEEGSRVQARSGLPGS